MTLMTKFIASFSFSVKRTVFDSIKSHPKRVSLLTKGPSIRTGSLIPQSHFHYATCLSDKKPSTSGIVDPDIDLEALKKSPEIQQLLQIPEIVAEFKTLLTLLQKHDFNWATARNPMTLLKVMSDTEVRSQLAKIQKLVESKGLKMDMATLKTLMKL